VSYIKKPRDQNEWAASWSNATFVFDTNVLLSMYRATLDESLNLITFLKSLGDKVWLPYQVAMEFNNQRYDSFLKSKTIMEVEESKRKFDERKTNLGNLDSLKASLLKQIDILGSDDADQKREELELIFSKFKEYFPEISLQPVPRDLLLDQIADLFNQRIGPPPNTQGDVDALHINAERRAQLSIPPGFKDAKKQGFTFDRTLRYQNADGDFILWSQILEHARIRQISTLFFITDDKKIDWWDVVKKVLHRETKATKKQLIDEALIVGHIEHFEVYSFTDFKKHSAEYLGYVNPQATLVTGGQPLADSHGNLIVELTIEDLHRGSDPRTLENRRRIFFQCFQYVIDEVADYVRRTTTFSGVMLNQSPYGLEPSGLSLISSITGSSKLIHQVSQPAHYEVTYLAQWNLHFATPQSWTKEMIGGLFIGWAEVVSELKITLMPGYSDSLLVERSEVVQIVSIDLRAS
jgi:hypothetical protein